MFTRKIILALVVAFAFSDLNAQVIPVDAGSSGGSYLISSYPGNLTSYYEGFSVIFRSNHNCPASPTMNVASLGPKPIVNATGAALSAGDIKTDQVVVIYYDVNAGGRFQMVTASGNAGGGGITGGGTASYIPRWATASTLTTSVMFDDGANIGIGTAIPGHKLDVSGTGAVYSRISTTTTGAANEGGLLLSRGDMANGYAQSHYLTGATFHWSTGLRQGDNNFHFWNAMDAADRMTIQAGTGNVGIGATAPNTALDINGAFSMREMATPAVSPFDEGRIYFDNTANKFKVSEHGGAYVDLVGSGGLAGSGILNHIAKFTPDGSTLGYSELYDDGTNVAVGSTSPQALFHVSKKVANGTPEMWVENTQSAGEANIQLKTNGGALDYLEIYKGGPTASGTIDGIALANLSAVSAGATAGPLMIRTVTNNPIYFLSNNLKRMTLDGNGNLGIGTTTPGVALDVVNLTYPNAPTIRSRGAGNPALNVTRTNGTGGTLDLAITDGSPAWFTGGITSGDAIIKYGSGKSLQIGNNSAGPPLVTVDASGNVGIGINTPGAKLEVAGQVKITGGAPANGAVLTSDASGLATWQMPAAGGITGSGTLNYLPKFTPSGTVLGDSKIFDNGTSIGVGTSSPSEFFHVRRSAVAATAEKIAMFDISDGIGSFLKLVNHSTADGNFEPKITATQIGSNGPSLTLEGDNNNDASAGEAVVSVNAKSNNGTVTARKLFDVRNNGSIKLIMDAAGKTGIGTSTPLMKLDVRGTNATITPAFENIFLVGSTDANPLAVRLGIQTHGTASSRFGSIEVDDAGTKRKLEIQPNGGDVGIGSFAAGGSALTVNGPSASFTNGSGPMTVSVSGTLLGASTLAVDGDVRVPSSGDYTYTSAKFKRTRIPASQFVGGLGSGTPYVATYGANGNYVSFAGNGIGTSNGFLSAPLQLPDSATITGFEVRLMDNDATVGYNMTVALYSGSANAGTPGSTTLLGSVASTDAGTNPNIQSFTSTLSKLVDYANEQYFFYVTTKQNNANLRLYTVIVYYTVSAAD